MRPTLPVTASLLMLLALPAASKPAARPAAPAGLSARAELDSIGQRYRALTRYRFEGTIGVVITGGQMDQKVEVPVLYTLERPNRLRTEVNNPAMGTIMVSDGDTLTVSAPALQQYTQQPAPALLGNDAFSRQVDPLAEYARVAATAIAVRVLGRDTVQTADRVVDAVRLEVTTAPDSSARGLTMHPRVWWVDPATHLVLRDSLNVDIAHPQLGPINSVQVTRLVRFSDGAQDAAVFRFVPAAGDRKVSRIAPPGQGVPEIEGKQAPEFSLERLAAAAAPAKPARTAKAKAAAAAAAKPVSLSALKGQVVVLDFWATWCGPCRRWMPIVDKAHAELGSKGMQVFAVNLRESEEQVRGYLAKTSVSVPVLLDRDGKVGAAYGASSIPLTVIIGRDGKVVRALVGAHPEEDLRDALREAGIE